MNKDDLILNFDQLRSKIETLQKQEFSEVYIRAEQENPWFIKPSIDLAFNGIKSWLTKENLKSWIEKYPDLPGKSPKKVGLVLAGNIPMVGFHDVLSTIMSGNIAVTKLSSKDNILMNFLRQALIEIHSEFEYLWLIVERLEDIDAIIATGSNNSSRYFEYYFSKYPNIIRKNRTSVAVLNGDETDEDLHNLGEDIFNYFGLGCRNVTYLFLHESVDPIDLFKKWEVFDHLRQHNKFLNNYEYYRSIFLVNQDHHLASDFLILKEGQNLFSPIANMEYSKFKKTEDVKRVLSEKDNDIQCIVSKVDFGPKTVDFGMTQKPALEDYADGIDTMKFLETI